MAKRKSVRATVDTFNPPLGLLRKIGSIVVHADELTGTRGHQFDSVAIRSLLAERDVQDWLAGMEAAGLIPVKR